jgi:hypothetical protein
MPAHPKPPKKQRRPGRRIGKVSGTVRLYGKQRKSLRERVFDRAGGYCEAESENGEKFDVCLGYTSLFHGHLAHIKSVGSGGPDMEKNTVWCCIPCHIFSHTKGIRLKEVSE